MTVQLMQNVSVDPSRGYKFRYMPGSLANKERLSLNTVVTRRPLSKGSANIVGRLTKHVNALRTVESAIFAGGKTTFHLFVYKTNQ